MKIVTVMPVDIMTGSMSKQPGLVFFPWRGLLVARQHVIPRNPKTADQVAIRNYMTQASQGFQTITPTQKANWATYATKRPHIFYGKEIQIPEISAYDKVNIYRLIDGQSVDNDAPTELADFVATGVSNLAYNSGTSTLSFDLSHNASVVTNKKWAIYLTASLPSQVYSVRDGDYRMCKGITADSIISVSASPQTINIVNPNIGGWQNNDYMSLKFRPLSPDYDSGTIYEQTEQITVT